MYIHSTTLQLVLPIDIEMRAFFDVPFPPNLQHEPRKFLTQGLHQLVEHRFDPRSVILTKEDSPIYWIKGEFA